MLCWKPGSSAWSIAIALVLISAQVGMQSADAMPVPQQTESTDAKLTCPQMLAEVDFRNRELDLLQDAMDKVEVDPSAETQAIAAAAQAVALLSMTLSVPPPVAVAIGTPGSTAHLKSASNDLKRALAPLQAKFDFALDRMDHLHGLYQRRCMARR
jgi:hypothetical protein